MALLIISVCCYILIGLLLLALAVYDLKYYILPNKLNAALALAFLSFHLSTGWQFISLENAAAGALVGGGFLLTIRFIANAWYKEDAVGLGDVKLMTAAGLGLGFPDILLAISGGAFIGLLHGMIMGLIKRERGEDVSLGKVNVPAGLGLCIGIAIVMIFRFQLSWLS